MQKLPVSNFKWVENGLSEKDILTYDETGDIGYFVEVDAHIPDEHHDYLNDMPPFPESLLIDETMASSTSRSIREKSSAKNDKYSTVKLAPNLLPKKKYICHISALQFYLKQGAVLDEVHRVLEFKQVQYIFILSLFIFYNKIQ